MLHEIQNFYSLEAAQVHAPASSNNLNQAAIDAVEQMEKTLAQLQTCASQNPPDWQGVDNAGAQLTAQWHAFDQIPVNDPDGFIAAAKQSVYNSLQCIQGVIASGNAGELVLLCPSQQQQFSTLITLLQVWGSNNTTPAAH